MLLLARSADLHSMRHIKLESTNFIILCRAQKEPTLFKRPPFLNRTRYWPAVCGIQQLMKEATKDGRTFAGFRAAVSELRRFENLTNLAGKHVHSPHQKSRTQQDVRKHCNFGQKMSGSKLKPVGWYVQMNLASNGETNDPIHCVKTSFRDSNQLAVKHVSFGHSTWLHYSIGHINGIKFDFPSLVR